MTLVMPEPDFDVGRVWDLMGEAKLAALTWTVARGESWHVARSRAKVAFIEVRPEEVRPEEEERRHMRSSTLMKRR